MKVRALRQLAHLDRNLMKYADAATQLGVLGNVIAPATGIAAPFVAGGANVFCSAEVFLRKQHTQVYMPPSIKVGTLQEIGIKK